MAKTIEQLKAQGAEVKNATVVGENTATRVGTLFNDIVEHVEDYEAKQAERDTKQDNETANLVSAEAEARDIAINNEAQERAKNDESLNNAIVAETARAKAAEQANAAAIAAEEEARSLAISQEAQERAKNDESLNNAIVAETARAKAAEQANAAAIAAEEEARSLAISQEAQTRATNDKQLNGSINAESNRAKAAEQANAAAIAAEEEARSLAISQEAQTRATNDKQLNGSINAESNRAKAAEKTINIELNKKIDATNFNNQLKKKADKDEVTASLIALENKIGERTEISGDVVNNPDEEDLTTQEGKLMLKNRAYEPLNYSGKGYEILRKNMTTISVPSATITVISAPTANGYISVIVDGVEMHINVTTEDTVYDLCQKIATEIGRSIFDKFTATYTDTTVELTGNYEFIISDVAISAVDTGATFGSTINEKIQKNVNLLTQDMMVKDNTIYVFRYDYELNNATINIPEGSVLKFDGGRISNGHIILSQTDIKGTSCFYNINFSGTCINNIAKQDWFYNNDIDGFIGFINSTEGCSVFSFISGIFYPTKFINKQVEGNSSILIIGNGCKLYYNTITIGNSYFNIRPKVLVEEIIEIYEPVYQGALKIKVPDTTKFKRGDYVIIRDYAISSFNYCRNYQQGEVFKVEQVDAINSCIIPDHCIYGNYTHISEAYNQNNELIEGRFVKLIKTSLINVCIENIDIKLVPDLNVSKYYTLGANIVNAFVDIKNFNVYNFSNYCIALDTCIDSKVENCHIQNTRDVGTEGDSYGLKILGCQNLLVTSCALYGGRHGITIGGHYKGDTCTVSRYITIHACKVVGYRSGSGLNAHGAAEHLTVTECTTDEISLGCNNCKVVNCNATGIRSFDGITFNWVIENNTLSDYIILQTRYIAGVYESTKRNYFINHDDELCIIKNNIITNGGIDILTNGDDEDDALVESMFENLLNTKFIISDNVCGGKIQLRLIRKAYQNYPELVDYVKKSSIAIVKNNTFTITGSSDSTSSIFCKTLIMDNNYINIPLAKNDYRIKVDNLLLRNNTFNYTGDNTNNAIIEYGSTNTLTIEDNIIPENRPLIAATKTYRTTQGHLVARRNKGYLSYTVSFAADDIEYNFDVLLEDNISGRNERFDGCNVVYKSAYEDDKVVSFETLIGTMIRDRGVNILKFDKDKTIIIPPSIKRDSFKSTIGEGSYLDVKIHNKNNIKNYRTFGIILREQRADSTDAGEYRIMVTNESSYCVTTMNAFHRNEGTYYPNIKYYYDLENNDYYMRIYETNGSYNTLIEIEIVNNSTYLSEFEISKGSLDVEYTVLQCFNNGVVAPVASIPTSGLNKRSIGELIMVNNKLSMFNGVSFVDTDGAAAGVIRNGNTKTRPSGDKVYIGFMYFDTTLNKPIYVKEIADSIITWVDANGMEV